MLSGFFAGICGKPLEKNIFVKVNDKALVEQRFSYRCLPPEELRPISRQGLFVLPRTFLYLITHTGEE